jgi:Ras-related protein Rab-8A
MGIILVYDCTEENTYNNIQNWLKQIEAHASDNVVKVLVANKTDLPNRVVSEEKGQELADQHGLHFFECSAKNGQNINELFMHVAEKIIEKRPSDTVSKQSAGQASVVN